MQKFLKSGNVKLYLYLGVLLVMAALWRTGEAINIQLGMLSVHEAPKTGSNAAALDEKSFYPVWVKQAAARAPIADESQVDLLFKRKEEEVVKPVKPMEPDYGQIFRQAVQIDGVSNDGLFISGHFYAIGEKLETFAMITAEGKRLVPKLNSFKNGKAVFDVGAQKIAIVVARKV